MKILFVIALISQLVSPSKEAEFRSQLPRVDDGHIQRLLDGDLFFYTDVEIPPAYQDGSHAHSPSYNIATAKNRQVNPELHGNGNREFPWLSTGGTHRADIETFRFMFLPTRDGQKLPIVWYRKNRVYDWTFPVGAIVGEVLQMRDPKGNLVTFELRLRIREYGEWGVDVFRPFPTAESLVARIEQLRPYWEMDANLVRLWLHLRRPIDMSAHRLRDNNHSQVTFDRSAGVDILPQVGDDALVARLLDRTFTSSLGQSWRSSRDGADTAAPTTQASFHIIPANYDAGFIQVDRYSCMGCHETANRDVNEFDSRRDWYGRIRGNSGGIFSFHPFALNSISYNGTRKAVRMNPKLSGLLEKYDARKHPPERYQRLK